MTFKFLKVSDLPKDKNFDIPNTLWAFIWYFVRQAKWQFALISALMIVSTALLSLAPYFVKLFVDSLETMQNRAHMWDEIAPILIAFVLLCGVLQSVLFRTAEYLRARLNPYFASMTRRQLSQYMAKHSYTYFSNDFAGRLSSKVIETPGAIRRIVTHIVNDATWNFVSFFVSIILLASISFGQLLIILSILCVYSVLLWIYLPQIRHISKYAADNYSIARGHYVDIVTNVLNVKLFAREKYEDRRFIKSLHNLAKGYETKGLKVFQFVSHLDTLLKLIWVLPGSYALYQWSLNEVSTGDVALAFTTAFQLGGTMWGFTFILSGFFENLGAVEEGMETVIRPHGVTDIKSAKKLAVQDAAITFKSVNFNYGRSRVFKGFNLDVTPGQKIGLIGPSGAGKSTLVNLLLRLYDIDNGEILIDGQDIAKIKRSDLREHIAVIPQSTQLFHRSLMDNIRYGNLKATDQQVIRAAKKAHAHDFIKNMVDHKGNKGYAALAGERGVKLSGGQRQRIAIARAILKNAPILILDEATSALDSESEKLIQDSLKTLMKGKTVIAIAHRLSTIADLDRLIVMDEGRLIEDGTHRQLLLKKGLYAKLWSMQSGGFLTVDEAR